MPDPKCLIQHESDCLSYHEHVLNLSDNVESASIMAITFILTYTLSFLITIAEMASAQSFRVDVHTHPVPSFFKEALVDAGYLTQGAEILVDGFRTPNFTVEQYIEERVEHGYNFSILSVTAPGVSFLKGNSRAKTLARQLNDDMSSYMKTYPRQLGAFACLPLPNVQDSIEEIKVCSMENINECNADNQPPAHSTAWMNLNFKESGSIQTMMEYT